MEPKPATVARELTPSAAQYAVEETVDLLRRALSRLVSLPESVEIATESRAAGTQFTLRAAGGDLERIMASARMLSSLQCIVKAMGERSGLLFELRDVSEAR